MSRIAIVVGHARRDTFCEALAQAYADGARAAGHTVELFVTSRMSFDPILHDGFEKLQPLEPDLAAAHSAIMQADHLVLIFPLWLGTLPAIFKGFLERVLQPDLIQPSREGRFVPILEGKSARVIMTMGMPGLVYRWWYGAHALKMLKRNILEFVGVSPVRSTVLGMIGTVKADQRQAWLQEVGELGRSGT
ncbi:MAG: NAD(P)H-dependent oxidoreductase [Hyphomicrobiaceae bacterium]|nr:NAD(P)H-dependent oxidoreductase [Hyphomicrobiaceae bacterium]